MRLRCEVLDAGHGEAMSSAEGAQSYLAVLSGFSRQLAGGPYSWLIPVSALVVVLAADPVRRRLERRFLGERREPLRVLARLDQMVATTRSDEQERLTTVAETVMQAVRCRGLWCCCTVPRFDGAPALRI